MKNIAFKITNVIQSKAFLICVWLLVTLLLAYYANTPNPRPMDPDHYVFKYPLESVILLSFYYAVFLCVYLCVFHIEWFKKHPYLSYFISSIIAVIFFLFAAIISMHSFGMIIVFIFAVVMTNLMHFVIYPLIWLFK
ncbi:hypothetical protein [Acinetobacter shaoyimingii]|uniref:Uncharacterized protein n=1 Tax=Acinetobacter shaoyimingii TaxID=2715164 RepID=A0A6G8RYE3_9GAMM|nr:hypothetical protein [Acinetobacter shaoyimingii]QIO06753.1 hypothetical protein G8E00_12775 [Acinetobacter shaoyimingii]